MNWGPITFLNPWGFLALVSLPVILAIHFFRHRYQKSPVSALFLWKRITREPSTGRRLERPPISSSLLLELLAALLLSFLLARPAFLHEQTHRIIALDLSASMLAEHNDGETSLQKIKEEARSFLSEDSGDYLYTIVASGYPPERVGSTGLSPGEAKKVINRLNPHHTSYNIDEMVQTIFRVGAEGAEVLFLTDQPPKAYSGQLPSDFTWKSVGKPLDNVAWIGGKRTSNTTGDTDRIMVVLKNYSGQPRNIRVNATAEDRSFLEKSIRVNGMDTWKTTIKIPRGKLEKLQFQLRTDNDALNLDNNIRFLTGNTRVLRAGIELPEGPARTAVRKSLQANRNVSLKIRDQPPHLLVGSANRNRFPPNPITYFGLKTTSSENNGRVRGPYLVEKTHPLLKNTVLRGVVFGGVNMERSPGNGTPLISSGDVPLLYSLSEGENNRYITNFTIRDSSIDRSIAWPILMSNLVDIARDRIPGPRRQNWRIDSPVQLNTTMDKPGESGEHTQWKLVHPDEQTESLKHNTTVKLNRLPVAGNYRLQKTNTETDAKKTWHFRVNFMNPEESNLTDLSAETMNTEQGTDTSRIEKRRTRPLQTLLLILVLGACLLNWVLLSKKHSASSEEEPTS